MTDAAMPAGRARARSPPIPSTRPTAEEFLAGREILADAGLLGDTVRFAYYGLEEPPKDEVLAGPAGRAGPTAGCGRS